jgi:hypothetical protein
MMMETLTAKQVLERYKLAKERRGNWENHWRECYEYALPHRESAVTLSAPGSKRTDRLFDGTAPDAVEQLAASLLSQLTPPWARWFGLAEGNELSPEEKEVAAPALEKASTVLQAHFDKSNFAVEMHQCYLDLVSVGTACLLFEEAPLGDASAFRFMAVPLSQVVFEENSYGALDTTFRRSEMRPSEMTKRFPKAKISDDVMKRGREDPNFRMAVVEAVIPDGPGYAYLAVNEAEAGENDGAQVLAQGKFRRSPFINFRWLKAPGEVYGRSPVMKALPDIKTANKVVELVLKNASIAVTGIWQADDDGVLNPASIKLVPGTIIPKAVGSAGLSPLQPAGRFDLSQLILKDLRQQIRKALLADKLGQPEQPHMTATEILERAAEMARLLGATYGRLQSELLTPLIDRAVAVLARRGVIPAIHIDGRTVELEYKSPLARQQARQDAQNAIAWLDTLKALGPAAAASVNQPAAVEWLAKAFGVPRSLIRQQPLPDDMAQLMPDLAGQAMEALSNPAAGEAVTALVSGLASPDNLPTKEPSDAE